MRQLSITIHVRRTAMTLVSRRHRRWMSQRSITICIGQTAILLGINWLLLMPLAIWIIATLYVPIMAPFLRPIEAWSVALVTTLLMGASLVGHTLAHIWTARVLRSDVPASISLYAFGDAAQIWPAAPSPKCEALIASAGPAANCLLAGLSYLFWSLQLHPYLDTSMLFLACANGGLVLLNLAPGFPLDGGRLVRAIIWGVLRRPDLGTRLGMWLGSLLLSALMVWAVLLLLEQTRFSLATSASTIFAATLLGLALWRQPAWRWEQPISPRLNNRALRRLTASLLVLSLLVISGSLLPMTHGLRTPGMALPVEPMVTIPLSYRHYHTGSFLLTTVIEQTPILAGQWAYAQWSPASEIVQPERVVPKGITPQALMKQNYRLLEKSERTATVVALQLADYGTEVKGVVVEVVSIQPGSWAHEILKPGDRIIRLNGAPLHNEDQLFASFTAQNTATTIDLEIERNGQLVELTFPVTPPMEADGPPWVDLTVQTVGYSVDAPFPVEIKPQKIVGGPSAGLMFTLTIYNLLTPEDLTGGRRIAGTGTMNLQGIVGPIGGVEQKVAAAEAAGADYFLVSSANYADAQRVARRIEVVEVATVEEAIEFLQSLPPLNDQ